MAGSEGAVRHCFARLSRYFQVIPAPGARIFPELAEHWFGI